MRCSRAHFKYTLRSAKQQEGTLRKESLGKKLALSQPSKFWQEIRVMNGNHSSLPSCVGGVTGKDEIADVWRQHFDKLFNCIQDDDVNTRMTNAEYSADIIVKSDEVGIAIRKLSTGKSSGLDGIYAEHLLHCSQRFVTMIAMCFTGLFVHGFLPASMLETVLVPVIKDKTGRIDQVDNYRPIALASVISKVIEIILLSRISGLLETCHNQFGFKQSLGTDTCIYVLKEIIDKYRSLNGGLFMCFLDASKAFDRVKHSVLFDKLVQRGVPGYIMRILCYWYAHQTMCVRWGSSISSSFRVSNGVRQGGILSPYLFNVYVDDLSQTLIGCRTGCLSGNLTINHLMYADDLVLISPSATGLRELICACEEFSNSHDVVYNSKKSSVLICRNKVMVHADPLVFTVNGSIIGESDKVKYLGHIICNDMSDDDDIMRQRRQLYAQGNVLSRRFHMCSFEVKNVLFRTFCTPMYTRQLWFRYTARSLHKLYVAYNNAFRMMHHLPTYCSASGMFTVNRVPNCAAVISNLTFRFMSRLNLSSNGLVCSIIDSDLKFVSRIRQHWMNMLYVHFSGG